MSEFTASYHLRSTKVDDVVALLRRSRTSGFVLPSKNGWVTFFPEPSESKPPERLAAENTGILVYFEACEDHGWAFSVFQGPVLKSRFSCDWTRKIRVDTSAYSETGLRLVVSDSTAIAEIEKLFRPSSFQEAIKWRPASVFAKALGLTDEAWLSFDYVSEDPESCHGVTKV